MIRSSIFCLLIGVLAATGCTARYSQALAGRIAEAKGSEVRSSDTGFSLFQITFTEPRSAHEQATALMGGCKELNNVEVDYRELLFFIVGIPRVTVTGTCVR